MEANYEFVELRVAYPGHPRIALVDGVDTSGNLNRVWGVADQFFHRREPIGERQQLVFRLPVMGKIWEVTEEIGERTRYRYLTVIRGSLRRIDYQSVVSVLRGKMRLAEAVRLRDLLLSDEHQPLIDYESKLGNDAMLAVPTPDHYLPLLYVIGTRTESEAVSFPVEGVDGGSISMLAVRLG